MEIELKEGEALTQEQINDLSAKIKLAEELKTKNEQVEVDKANLIEELKEERQKKQDALNLNKAAEDLKGDPVAQTRTIVESMLNEEKTKQIETSRTQFEADFKATNPEFETSNDPTGIKFQAFKKVLNRFNLNSLSTEQEFADVYSDAMIILKREDIKTKEQINQNSFTPGTKSSSARTVTNSELTSKEEKLLNLSGMSKERYLKLKVNQPDYIRDLLEKVRD